MNKSERLVAYYKEVLDKISFADRATFRKELRKAFRNLLPEDRAEIKEWYRNACVCRVAYPARRPVRTDRSSQS